MENKKRNDMNKKLNKMVDKYTDAINSTKRLINVTSSNNSIILDIYKDHIKYCKKKLVFYKQMLYNNK